MLAAPVALVSPAGLGIDPVPHIFWAKCVGLHIARAARLRGQEREDVVAVAYLELVKQARRYDPARLTYGEAGHLFRGWARQTLLTACRRAATLLRLGGVKGAEGHLPAVDPLSGQTTPAGDPVEPGDLDVLCGPRLVPANDPPPVAR